MHETPRVDAHDLRDRLAVGAREWTPLGLIERHRHRGCLWHCPCCGQRTRWLYRPDGWGQWSCRLCAELDYPSQRISANRRHRTARERRQLPRTLDASRFAIMADRMETAHAVIGRLADEVDAVMRKRKG